jgi:hypothetical protein
MTQDEIIEMARQARLMSEYDEASPWVEDHEITQYVEAFAKLVAAKAIAELESQERNFCPRCGKRTNDIHTCTPPQRSESSGKPSAWVGLTDDEISALSKGHIVRSTYARAIEAKLKQKNGFAEEKST